MKNIYTDASADSNNAVIGFTCYDNHVVTSEKTRVLKKITVNQAEMISVLFALTEYPREPLTIHSDSEYVVKTLNGEYKIKKHKELWEITKKLFEQSKSHITHVKGHAKNERNNRIDKLVRTTLRNTRK